MILVCGESIGPYFATSYEASYAANFVVTRYSVLNGLTSFDLAALRFSVAGLLMLPYFYRLGLTDLGGIGWPRAILLSCLAGSPYMLVFFYGLSFAPASHGAVLNPGTLIAVPLLGEIPTSLQWIGIILVCPNPIWERMSGQRIWERM